MTLALNIPCSSKESEKVLLLSAVYTAVVVYRSITMKHSQHTIRTFIIIVVDVIVSEEVLEIEHGPSVYTTIVTLQ